MEKITRQVTLKGIRPIMMDRFSGSIKNSESMQPMEKLYLQEKNLVFPATNISSFLSSQNSESATQRVMGRTWKATAKAALSFVDIEPVNIPITRESTPLTLDNADVKIHKAVARVKKGQLSIPCPKERPVIDTPWEMSFKITLYRNPDLNESTLKRIFEEGGLSIGLGTFRGVFGKFVVDKWE